MKTTQGMATLFSVRQAMLETPRYLRHELSLDQCRDVRERHDSFDSESIDDAIVTSLL